MTSAYTFKVADQPWEMAAIHRLNYRTFVEEIPQHDDPGTGELVDRFHEENVYVICLSGGDLAGMAALRFQRPFSVEMKVVDFAQHLPPGHEWCEVRLLAVERKHRRGPVAAGLISLIREQVKLRGVDACVISATTRQLRFYGHLGFTAFGPLVGREGAWYQPMHLDLARLESAAGAVLERVGNSEVVAGVLNFLPGPVQMRPEVRAAMAADPVSHRSPVVMEDVREIQRQLSALTNAAHVSLLPGGGTLANELVAAQISRLEAPGMVVSCGEFGERLADHARRAWLPHEHLALPAGMVPEIPRLEALLDRHPEVQWLWTTHCETSTGALVDLPALVAMCERRGILLALDAVSSVGVVPVDLSGVWLAAASSGKGLAAQAGIAILLHREPVPVAVDKVPRAVDAGLCAAHGGMPFTLSSNLVRALRASLEHTDWAGKYQRVALQHTRLRNGLSMLGAQPVWPALTGSPGVLTVPVPEGLTAGDCVDILEAAGIWIHGRSSFLARQRYVQFCLMGEMDDAALEAALRRLSCMVNFPWRGAGQNS